MSITVKNKGIQATVDNMTLIPVNEKAVMMELGAQLALQLKRRAKAGVSSRGGALRQPKDAGTPANPQGHAYNRTGALSDSIDFKLRKRKARAGRGLSRERHIVVISAYGNRATGKARARRTRRSREKTAGLRAAAIVGALFSNQTSEDFTRRYGKQGRRIRVRYANTSAAVAAILSVPPKDSNSKKGSRAVYRVIELTRAEQAHAERYLIARIRMSLVKSE